MQFKNGALCLGVALGLLTGSTASAACWSWTSGPTFESRWYMGLDNTPSADDTSVLTDNALLRNYFPLQCSGAYGCDVVQYSIQWSAGQWSPTYYPGVNDADPAGYTRRAWAYFSDHNFSATLCN